MESLFILISLIFHGISFLIIFLLYQKVQRTSEAERNFEQRVQEVEDIFSSYLLEIKDENKKFLEHVSSLENKTQNKPNPDLNDRNQSIIDQKSNEIIKNINIDNNSLMKSYDPSHIKPPKERADYNIETMTVTDRVEAPSVQGQIMNLYEKGYSVEEIAKKLNKGNTEVELIVKFNRKMMN